MSKSSSRSKVEFNSLGLRHILSRFMANKKLMPQDLAERTGLPPTTINNILRGKSKNPRPDTLKLIADVFNISIGQLVGYESLKKDAKNALFTSFDHSLPQPLEKSNTLPPSAIPLITWEKVRPWLTGQTAVKAYASWLPNNTCKSFKSFALKAKPSMRSHFFYPTATLLVDPEAPVEDGLITLVFLNASKEPSLKILTLDGEKRWLKPLEKGIPPILFTEEHTLVGPVVEVRFTPDIK